MSNKITHGSFCWNELLTRDSDAAGAFFAELLGWRSEAVPMPGEQGVYTLFHAGETRAAGMMKMDGPQWDGIPPHWLSYIAVDDVDAAAAKTEALGGSIRLAPMDIPGIGRFCIIADPTGAVVALITLSEALSEQCG